MRNLFITLLMTAVWSVALTADLFRENRILAMTIPMAMGAGLAVGFFSVVITSMWRDVVKDLIGDQWAILLIIFFGVLFAIWRPAMAIMALTLAGLAARHHWQQKRHIKTTTE